jgi:predicted N-acyltransferase
MQVDVVDRIDQVDRDEWNALAAGQSFYMTHEWLHFQELLTPAATSRYVLVRQETGALAGAVPVHVRMPPHPEEYRVSVLFAELNLPDGPCLLVGNGRGYQNRLLVDASLSEEDARLVARIFASAVQEIADEETEGILWWLYLDDLGARTLSDIYGHPPCLIESDCSIPLPGSSFDDYLDSLPSVRAKNVRRERRQYNGAGYQTAELRLADCWQVAGDLLCQTQRRYGHDADPTEVAHVLRMLALSTGDSGIVDGSIWEGRLVGFCLRFDRAPVTRFTPDSAPLRQKWPAAGG